MIGNRHLYKQLSMKYIVENVNQLLSISLYMVKALKDLCKYFDPLHGFDIFTYLIEDGEIIETEYESILGAKIKTLKHLDPYTVEIKTTKQTITIKKPTKIKIRQTIENQTGTIIINIQKDREKGILIPYLDIVDMEINIHTITDKAYDTCM